MSSELCPFCGRTYKRLKSHLPHCKAAASSTTPAPAAKQAPGPDPASARAQKSKQTPSDTQRSAKASALSSTQLQSSTAAASASVLPATKTRKQKRTDRGKMACMPSPAAISPTSPGFSLRALTEAAAQAEANVNPHNETTAEGAPEKKAPRMKKAAESLSLDGDGNERGSRTGLWANGVGEMENPSALQLLAKSRCSQQGRIVLQDVKAALRRAKTAGRGGALSDTADDLGTEKQKGLKNCLVTAKAPSDQLPSSGSPRPSDEKRSLLCEQASLIPARHGASPQPTPASSTAPLLSGQLSSHVDRAAPPSHTVGTSKGLKVGRRVTGLLSTSPAPTHISCPRPLLLAPPVRVETPRAEESVTKENRQLKVGKQTDTEGSLTQRHLGQVRLRELPEWLACKTPRRPRDVVEMVQRGWQWYHRRYVDVKKGGVGGVGMLLAGYCVLGYIWSYPHIKRDRWRKYH